MYTNPNYEIPVTGIASTPANIPFPPMMNGPMGLGQVNSHLQMGDSNPTENQIVQQSLVVPNSTSKFPWMGVPLMTDNTGLQHVVHQSNQQANPRSNHYNSYVSSISAVHRQPEDTYNGGLPWPPLNSSAGMSGSTKCSMSQYGQVSFQKLYEASVIYAQKRSPAPAPDDQNAKIWCKECGMFVHNQFAFLIVHLGEEHREKVKFYECRCKFGRQYCKRSAYSTIEMEKHIKKVNKRDGDKFRGYRMVDKNKLLKLLRRQLSRCFREETKNNVLRMLEDWQFTPGRIAFNG